MGSVANQLIEGLPAKHRRPLLAICEPVQLRSAEVLCDRDKFAKYIYFPTGSTISIWSAPIETPALEIAMVGSEGMLGVHAALGISTSAMHAQVQRPGPAWRIAAASFNTELGRNAPLLRCLNRYLHVILMQCISMVRCSRFHPIDQRLARWLLMSHDRAHGDTFKVTHQLMASMLGVRRVGITTAAVALQRCRTIEYARGEITILDRGSLEAAACPCYAAERQCYAKFFA
jgi:CRP-like cAMP-binding protein